MELKWDKAYDEEQEQLQGQQRELSLLPATQSSANFPVLGGYEACDQCFCAPCIIYNPPPFLVGSSVANITNNSKRFKLYRKFWKELKKRGMWEHPEYLERKRKKTSIDDPREILPPCVIQVSFKTTITWRYMTRPFHPL